MQALSASPRRCKQGKSVTLLEAREIGAQVTGRSTAKITRQHSLIYSHLIDRFGIYTARLYADANRAGCDQFRRWVDSLGIACDYEKKAAFAYASDADRARDIEAEVERQRPWVMDEAPLPFETAAAVCFPDQAQFNPASYLVGLAMATEGAEGKIFARSRARNFTKGTRMWCVETDTGRVEASSVVIAINIPVKSPVDYANRTQPRCRTAMAYRLRPHLGCPCHGSVFQADGAVIHGPAREALPAEGL